MKKFEFKLESYLKVRKFQEQTKLTELSGVMQKINIYREQQQMFEREYQNLLQEQKDRMNRETIDPTFTRDMYTYLAALKNRSQTATNRIAELEPELDLRRKAYNEARKNRRTIEIIKEKKKEAYKIEVNRDEIRGLDEFNQNKSYGVSV